IDETAQKIGATNTIVNKNDKLMGYNTDYYGAIEALKEKTPLNNKKALVLGAGGAARAVIYGLKKEGAGITIVNRTKEKAEKLASDFDVKFSEINNMKKLVIDNDIIVNTTSVGMVPNINESIIKEDEFVSGKIVMDIVPIPPNTKLLKIAKSAGCQVISGNRMLLHQAIKQFRLWTGQDPKFKLMESKLKLTL
ncbi:MAG: shikimate dehydrogenase, partial [Candidatus Woesearchaeota archaeon]|nr:shikimate dehydrogenase [Candidatus Woesearchaeota archaeon]